MNDVTREEAVRALEQALNDFWSVRPESRPMTEKEIARAAWNNLAIDRPCMKAHSTTRAITRYVMTKDRRILELLGNDGD